MTQPRKLRHAHAPRQRGDRTGELQIDEIAQSAQCKTDGTGDHHDIEQSEKRNVALAGCEKEGDADPDQPAV